MKALKWHQVHAWRLAQHGLSPRFSQRDFVKAVTLTGGIQAQVMSAAELALCTRVEGFGSEDVRSALWQDHTLVKTWAMRGTVHVERTHFFKLDNSLATLGECLLRYNICLRVKYQRRIRKHGTLRFR